MEGSLKMSVFLDRGISCSLKNESDIKVSRPSKGDTGSSQFFLVGTRVEHVLIKMQIVGTHKE